MTQQEKYDWEMKEVKRMYKYYKQSIRLGYDEKTAMTKVESSYPVYLVDILKDIIS